MGSVVLFPLGNYGNGSRQIGPHTIPGQINSVSFSLLRCTTADPTIWPNASTTFSIAMEVSYDDGVTWEDYGGFSAAGGIVPGKGGVGESAVSKGTWPFSGPVSVQARATVTVSGGPLRSEGTLSWE
jgi:hypothetical protein